MISMTPNQCSKRHSAPFAIVAFSIIVACAAFAFVVAPNNPTGAPPEDIAYTAPPALLVTSPPAEQNTQAASIEQNAQINGFTATHPLQALAGVGTIEVVSTPIANANSNQNQTGDKGNGINVNGIGENDVGTAVGTQVSALIDASTPGIAQNATIAASANANLTATSAVEPDVGAQIASSFTLVENRALDQNHEGDFSFGTALAHGIGVPS